MAVHLDDKRARVNQSVLSSLPNELEHIRDENLAIRVYGSEAS